MPRRNYFGGTLETGGTLEIVPVASPPTGRNVDDVYLDDGTNTVTGNPGWRYLVSQFPDVWADTSSGIVDTSAVHKEVADEFDTVALKATPATADRLLIEDSENSLNKKYITVDGLPTGSNFYGPAIVVGNSVAGDSSGNCHYLDVGDGVQLAAAIAAAAEGGNPLTDPPKDVLIKPGTYDFRNYGAPGAPIAIPDKVRVRGAGIGNTIIIGEESGDMGVFTLGDYCSLEDVLVQVPLITGAGTTSRGVVTIDGVESSCHRVKVEFLGSWGLEEEGNNFLWAAFLGEADAVDCQIVDCKAILPKLSEWGDVLRGVYLLEPTVNSFWTVKGNQITGSDVGIECQVRANIIGNEVREYHQGGVLVDASGVTGGFVYGSNISDNMFEIYDVPVTDPPDSGSYGIKCDGLSLGVISNNYLYGPALTTGVYAIWVHKGENNTISNNRGKEYWTNSMYLGSGADYNVVIGNAFTDAGAILESSSAVGNDFAHNS